MDYWNISQRIMLNCGDKALKVATQRCKFMRSVPAYGITTLGAFDITALWGAISPFCRKKRKKEGRRPPPLSRGTVTTLHMAKWPAWPCSHKRT